MSKLSKEEIEKRGRRMQQEALKSVAKREQLNIRMDEENIYRLYEFAKLKGKPVGTLVREWIVERLDLEQQPRDAKSVRLANDVAALILRRLA